MRCGLCGGALSADPADECWCVGGRFREAALRASAETVLQDARRDLIGAALGIIEAIGRQDGEGLACLLGSADLAATAVILGAIVRDLVGDLARSNYRDDGDLVAQLRANLLGERE